MGMSDAILKFTLKVQLNFCICFTNIHILNNYYTRRLSLYSNISHIFWNNNISSGLFYHLYMYSVYWFLKKVHW